MDIPNPRRILAVSPPDSGLVELLTALTGTSPTPSPSSLSSIAGTTHLHPITTPYYTATLPIWLDEITSPPTWASEFLAPEAREVLSVIGAFIVCFRKPVNAQGMQEIKELLEKVGEVVREGCGYGWDGVCLAVGMKQNLTPALEVEGEEWEDVCQGSGFEWVDFEGRGRNEFGESQGLERLKEALEANDWSGGEEYGGEIDFDGLEEEDEEGGELDFGIGREETKEEMEGMKRAIYNGGGGEDDDEEEGQDEEVEKLQAMMLKMQAVRDMGADLAEAERKRFAAKAVNDLMKTL